MAAVTIEPVIYLTPFGPAVPFVTFVIVSGAVSLFALGYALAAIVHGRRY